MRILLTNDDGIAAAGLRALEETFRPLAEVFVVAPATPRNAAARSFSLDRPIHYQEAGPDRFAVDGTPVDCVYLALHHLLAGRPPDLVLSGINHGPNLAQDVTYSGTVGAAMEAADWGALAVAVSAGDRHAPTFYDEVALFVRQQVLPLLQSTGLPPRTFLNVNVPRCGAGEGATLPWRITRQGRHAYLPRVVPLADPRGRSFCWLGGDLGEIDPDPASDHAALRAGQASLTPLGLDLTSAAGLERLRAQFTSP
ncbi:MAG: 5'/3'-nucleotidase SurE [Myxococcota bacterium]|nr:5'/3'-nucleotidase SurE [Myxococcota bacterium]